MPMPDFSLFYSDSLLNRNKNLKCPFLFSEYAVAGKAIFRQGCCKDPAEFFGNGFRTL